MRIRNDHLDFEYFRDMAGRFKVRCIITGRKIKTVQRTIAVRKIAIMSLSREPSFIRLNSNQN